MQPTDNQIRKRMGSGDPPGLQNRRAAGILSSVRSTRTRFRQFFFIDLQGIGEPSQTEIPTLKRFAVIKT